VPSVPVVKEKKNKVWGPILATRMSSRIHIDGKSAIEKAQELKKAKNMEIPQGNEVHGFSNSFAALDNDLLEDNARAVGISLGSSTASNENNIICLKNLEVERLSNFHNDHPDMFLPQDISLTVDGMIGTSSRLQEDEQSTHISEDSGDEEPWTEVSYKTRSRRKLLFKR
jgi:hypothetical protein